MRDKDDLTNHVEKITCLLVVCVFVSSARSCGQLIAGIIYARQGRGELIMVCLGSLVEVLLSH